MCSQEIISKDIFIYIIDVLIDIMIDIIATVMKQGLEDKCEVTGQGLFASLNTFHLSTAACVTVCDGAAVGHSNTDVLTPVVTPAAGACCLCLCQLQ